MASRCAACATEIPDTSRFCPACGAQVAPSSQAATERAPDDGGPPPRRLSSSTPSSAISGERFAPGTVLGGRYRIASRLGKGGMGEVYRADDLKLAHVVALKFLPEQLVADPARLARFHHEVKIARQISHPNVCRVYDITEADGQHFISMEYVDGEDLRSLLRRIGRLPADKAIQIARQLCAGLAAAHDKGVLHRDLKPANVMLDGEGRVRVTDFGLAALAGEVQGAEIRSGTPTYMAPEQLAGKEVSVASDLYALGLVLFELFTGSPAFRAASLAELVRLHAESGPTSPSSLVHDLDPAVERVILRCLAKHPTERPSSALAVAAALPGGDPLAAALAAGETPSPAMVAAAGDIGGLKPGIAWAFLLAILGGFALAVYLMQSFLLTAWSPLPKEPAVLVAEARRVIAAVGWKAEIADASWGFERNEAYLAHLRKRTDAARWDGLGTGERSGFLFWYRQSPRSLIMVPIGAALLARRNLRLGRGDRKGAFRIAAYFLATHAIVMPLTAKHFADLGAFAACYRALGRRDVVPGGPLLPVLHRDGAVRPPPLARDDHLLDPTPEREASGSAGGARRPLRLGRGRCARACHVPCRSPPRLDRRPTE